MMYSTIPTAGMAREEWLQLRKTGIGESDAGAVCGLNPYAGPMSVYRDKTSDVEEDREKKYYTTDRFYVRSVAYDRERCMDSLCIINSRNQVVYCMKGKIQEPAGSQPPGDTSRAKDAAGKGLSKTQMGKLKKELERTGVALEAVLERYRLRSAEQMTGEIYEKAMDCLRKSKSRDVA